MVIVEENEEDQVNVALGIIVEITQIDKIG